MWCRHNPFSNFNGVNGLWYVDVRNRVTFFYFLFCSKNGQRETMAITNTSYLRTEFGYVYIENDYLNYLDPQTTCVLVAIFHPDDCWYKIAATEIASLMGTACTLIRHGTHTTTEVSGRDKWWCRIQYIPQNINCCGLLNAVKVFSSSLIFLHYIWTLGKFPWLDKQIFLSLRTGSAFLYIVPCRLF